MYIIKNVIYKNNNAEFILNINSKSTIKYNDELYSVDNKLVLKYITSLYSIIEDWQEEYIDTVDIDGNFWELTLIYSNDTKKEYTGRSSYPDNFEAFEDLIYKILKEVRHV